jgi:hypothetical protein
MSKHNQYNDKTYTTGIDYIAEQIARLVLSDEENGDVEEETEDEYVAQATQDIRGRLSKLLKIARAK